MLHGERDVFVPFVIFKEWLVRLERFQYREQAIASLEWRLVNGTRHSISAALWPYIRGILKIVLTEPKTPFKL
jgi:hypothetical protein